VEDLKRRLEAVLTRHSLEFELDWSVSGTPFLTERGRLVEVLSAATRAVTGIQPELSTSGGTSDGRFIRDICLEVVELGPVNGSIHQIDEHVALQDVEALSLIYQRALQELLAP